MHWKSKPSALDRQQVPRWKMKKIITYSLIHYATHFSYCDMIITLVVPFIFVLLLQIELLRGELDDKLIEKDLYAVLRVKPNASLKEIKKSYRKLAQIHHPDKHINSANKSDANNVNNKKSSSQANYESKDMNEALFREIAEAHEVLSSAANREEYDYRRALYLSAQSEAREARNEYSEGRRHRNEDIFAEFSSSFENFFDSNRKSAGTNSADNFKNKILHQFLLLPLFTGYFFVRPPGLIGPVLPAGNVLFPYSPILARPNHFSYLDASCSLVVAEGDPEVFMYHLLLDVRTDGGYVPPVLEEIEYSEERKRMRAVFRSPSFPQLEGNCFAGLYEDGVLAVFAGHPDMPGMQPLWHSESENAQNEDEVIEKPFPSKQY